jgi:hypothetical protein
MLLLNQNEKRAPEGHLKSSAFSEICGMEGGGVLNRKLLLHSLEKTKYLNYVVDVLNSSGEFEGVLEVFSSCISRLFIAKKFIRRGRLEGFGPVLSIRLYAVRASD